LNIVQHDLGLLSLYLNTSERVSRLTCPNYFSLMASFTPRRRAS
jgi:hypothetical protein